MQLILIAIHLVVCVALILIVLLQRGKGSDMGAAFGGSSQAVFGSTGATSFLHKITVASAIVFMVTSLFLAFLFGQGRSSSIMKDVSPSQAPVTQQTQDSAPTGSQEKK